MRRSFAILLALVLSLGCVLPAFAQGASSILPACCRRTGAHHCSMEQDSMQAATGVPSLAVHGTNCPLFPQGLTGAHTVAADLAAPIGAPHRLQPSAEYLNFDDLAFRNRLLQHESGRGPPKNLRA